MLKKIIGYAIIKDSGWHCPSSIKIIRLVNKSWLQVVTKVLRLSSLPLFCLSFDKNTGIQELKEFKKSVLNKPKTGVWFYQDEAPTVQLTFENDFFSIENHYVLTAALETCSKQLVHLKINIPLGVETMPFLLPRVSLPVLNCINFDIACGSALQEANMEHEDDKEFLCGNSIAALYFLQHLFNMAEKLRCVSFPTPSNSDTRLQRILGFNYLHFPNTLTCLQIDHPLTGDQLMHLLNQGFQLQVLDIHISEWNLKSLQDGQVLTRLLQKFRQSLKRIFISGVYQNGNQVEYSPLFIPQTLEKLQTFETRSINLMPQKYFMGPEVLPNLVNLALMSQTIESFQKWACKYSVYHSVKNLNLFLVNKDVDWMHNGHSLPFSLERAIEVCKSFPNVTKLTLYVRGTETCGLRQIFGCLKELVSLSLVIKARTGGIGTQLWDSLITGVPEEILRAFYVNPDFASHVEFTRAKDRPSIQALKSEKICMYKLC